MSSPSHFQTLKHSFDGILVQLIPNPGHDLLLLNTVDPTNGRIRLERINFNTFKTEDGVTLSGEMDNFHVKHFNGSKIVGISFSQEQNPDLYDVHILDWSNPVPKQSFVSTRLLHCNDQCLTLPHPHFVGKTMEIDLRTGAQCSGDQPNPDNGLDQPNYPTAYTTHSAYFEWFAKLLNAQDINPVRQCEHLKWGENHLISYYTETEKTFSNGLCILDGKGKMIWQTTLAENLIGIGMDTFFVIKNRVIFTNSEHEIVALYE